MEMMHVRKRGTCAVLSIYQPYERGPEGRGRSINTGVREKHRSQRRDANTIRGIPYKPCRLTKEKPGESKE